MGTRSLITGDAVNIPVKYKTTAHRRLTNFRRLMCCLFETETGLAAIQPLSHPTYRRETMHIQPFFIHVAGLRTFIPSCAGVVMSFLSYTAKWNRQAQNVSHSMVNLSRSWKMSENHSCSSGCNPYHHGC